ncbi:MAG: hypothetical protein ACI9LO_002175 [Planctomycetota bacterium]
MSFGAVSCFATPNYFPEHNSLNTLTNTIKRHPFYTAAIALVALYAVLGFFLTPYLLQKTLTGTMKDEFNADLQVERIEVNPFVLSLRVNGLSLDNPDGEPTLRVEEIFANFQLSSIFNLALTFDEIRFSAPEVFVARNQAGDLDFAYLTKSSTDQASQAKGDASLPPVLVDQFSIEDLVIRWADQVPVEAVKTRFGPIVVDLKDFSTFPNQAGQQTVVISTHDFGTLSWTGDLQLNPFRTSAHASLKAAPFALLSTYIRHQAGIDIVDGSADIELDYNVQQVEKNMWLVFGGPYTC